MRALPLEVLKFRLCRTSEPVLLGDGPSLSGLGLPVIFGCQQFCYDEMFPGMIRKGV